MEGTAVYTNNISQQDSYNCRESRVETYYTYLSRHFTKSAYQSIVDKHMQKHTHILTLI